MILSFVRNSPYLNSVAQLPSCLVAQLPLRVCIVAFTLWHNCTHACIEGPAKVSEGEHVRNNHLHRTEHWIFHGLLHRRYLGVPKTSLRVHEQEPDVTFLERPHFQFSNILSNQIKCIKLSTIKQQFNSKVPFIYSLI